MSTAELYDINVARQQRSNRVENQKLGYIPLYRSIKNKPWAKDVFLRTLWDNLLFAAQRGDYVANFKGNLWRLKAGQLVTTPADLGLELCDRKGNPTSRDTVNRMLAVFVREGMITISGEKHKGTVITINNYSEYAQNIGNVPAHKYAHVSAHGESSDTNASGGVPAHDCAHDSAHHEQEYKSNNKLLDTCPRIISDRVAQKKPEAAVSNPKGDKWGNSDDLKTVEWIYSKILALSPSAKKPNWAAWANDIRLMRQQDNHTHEEICRMFQWANKDSFWRSNILSPAKLREKWTQLEAKRNTQQPSKPQASSNQIDYDNTDWAEGLEV